MASASPGLLAAARDRVRVVNSPGSSLVEAPALAAFLPQLAMRLLGRRLALPSVPTVWLGNSTARAGVLREHGAMVPPPGAGDEPAAGPVGEQWPSRNGRAMLDRVAGGALALRGERGGDALGGAMLRRRRPCAAPRAGSYVPGARPQRLARDARRAWLRAGGPCAVLAEFGTAARQGCLGAGGKSGCDRRTASGEYGAAGDPTDRRRHAKPCRRQLLLARTLP